MRTFRKLGIATIVCVALNGAAWAHSGSTSGGSTSTSGRGDTFQSMINAPQVTTPLIHRSGSQQLAPIVNHRVPSNSITDNHGNRGIGLRGHDFKEHGRDAGRRFDNLDRKQVTTRIDGKAEKAERAEKAEKEVETRLAANTADDTSRKTETNQPQISCR